MVEHLVGRLWYCGVLGAENGAFSAKFSVLAGFSMLFMLRHCAEQHSTALIAAKCATKEFPTTEFPATEKVNSFVIVPSEEIQKEKGDESPQLQRV